MVSHLRETRVRSAAILILSLVFIICLSLIIFYYTNYINFNSGPEETKKIYCSNFSNPHIAEGLNLGDAATPVFSDDLLEVFFISTRLGGEGGWDIWKATRDSINDSFSDPVNINELNSNYHENNPFLSSDGLTIYFGRGEINDIYRIFAASRTSKDGPFGVPVEFPELSAGNHANMPSLTPDELTIYFASNREGGLGNNDIWKANRTTKDTSFANLVPISSLNSETWDGDMKLTSDGLSMIYSSSRVGVKGQNDIMIATRDSQSEPFSSPIFVDGLNSAAAEAGPVLVSGGKNIFYSWNSGSPDTWYIYTAECIN